jgi:hypothetical protein
VGQWYSAHKDDPDCAFTDTAGGKQFSVQVVAMFKACLTRPVPSIVEPRAGAQNDTAYSRAFETVELLLRPGLSKPKDLGYHRLRELFQIEPDDPKFSYAKTRRETQGLDDPSNKPRVDIIVPDGVAGSQTTTPDASLYDASLTFSAEQTGASNYKGAGCEVKLSTGGTALFAAGSGLSQSTVTHLAAMVSSLGKRTLTPEKIHITPNLSGNSFVGQMPPAPRILPRGWRATVRIGTWPRGTDSGLRPAAPKPSIPSLWDRRPRQKYGYYWELIQLLPPRSSYWSPVRFRSLQSLQLVLARAISRRLSTAC